MRQALLGQHCLATTTMQKYFGAHSATSTDQSLKDNHCLATKF